MDTLEKLRILSEDSKYDLACACGTSERDRRRRGLEGKWLYPVALPSGGYSILLKTLLSNVCANDCKYCPLRAESAIRRCTIEPEAIAQLFMEYYRRGKVFGLFLSSGVPGTPDAAMDRIIASAKVLREKHEFRGYIHLKVIPGASDAAIEEAIGLASAVSLNIEVPRKQHFALLSSRKDYMQDIIRPLKLMGRLTGKGMRHERVKCTTQFIVGASTETDSEIVAGMYGLYERLNFHRVYFSAYQKGLGNPAIPGETISETEKNDAFVREHRLYQVDFLARKYGFRPGDIVYNRDGSLNLEKDPKELWAENHPEFFPVRIRTASRDALLRVPGIGPETAKRILKIRHEQRIWRLEDIGIKGKRLLHAQKYLVPE